MPSIFSVYVHHGFRRACKYFLSHQSTIAKHPPKPHARFSRVRKAKAECGSVYQVVGKDKDHHRRTVKRYKRVDKGSMIRDVNSPEEWVTVKGKWNHEEKNSPRLDREDRAEEYKNRKPKQRKKLEKTPKSSRSDPGANSPRKGTIEHARHFEPSRRKQNVDDTWSTTYGTIVSLSIGPQSDCTIHAITTKISIPIDVCCKYKQSQFHLALNYRSTALRPEKGPFEPWKRELHKRRMQKLGVSMVSGRTRSRVDRSSSQTCPTPSHKA
jgi:hypothetical protein